MATFEPGEFNPNDIEHLKLQRLDWIVEKMDLMLKRLGEIERQVQAQNNREQAKQDAIRNLGSGLPRGLGGR